MRKTIGKLLRKLRARRFDISILEDLEVVNIGAGITRLDFATNVDISPKADVVVSLGEDPLPFADASVDVIFSDHTFEHIPNYLFLIEEVHRILKPGGILILGTPYVSLTKYHLVNPYHIHNFNEYSFDFFDPTKLRGSAAEVNQIDLRLLNCSYNYLGIFMFLPLIRAVARKYLFNVVRDIQFAVVKGPKPQPYSSRIAADIGGYYAVIAAARRKHVS